MALSKETVEHIAKLARLRLTEEEKERYGDQLSSILSYVEKIQAVDTADVAPTSQVTGLTNIMREDNIRNYDIAKELVQVAPDSTDGFIKIPKVFEDK